MLQFCQRSNRHTNLASRIPSVIADSARATTTVRQTRPLVTMAGSTQQARFSKGTDEAAAASRLDALVLPAGEGGAAAASASAEGRWTLAKEGEALERSFKFKTFAKTWVRFYKLTALLSLSHTLTLPFPFPLTLGAGTDAEQDFMTAVSLQCKLKNHHPEWSNVGPSEENNPPLSVSPSHYLIICLRSTTQHLSGGRRITQRASRTRIWSWPPSVTP